MVKPIVNVITSFRILCSILMAFSPAFSSQFYVMYFLGGLSDMADGAVARKTNSISEFGAKFDTVADFIFAVVCFIKLLPEIDIPKWLWIWVGVIAIIKIGSIIWGFVYRKKLISLHTIMNKTTGLLLFLLPLTLNIVELKYSCTVICSIATFSSIQECYYIVTDREIVNSDLPKS